jgi:DNA polymerase III delta prime subunit
MISSYCINKQKDFLGDHIIFDEIKKNIGNGIQILHGESGTGKTSVINLICNTNNIDALEFNAGSKKSLKYFNEKIFDFLSNKSLEKTKAIIFDDFEVLIQEHIGAISILDILCNYTQHPIFICVNSFYIQKLEKYKKCNMFFYKIPMPTKALITKHCLNITKKENIPKSKTIIQKLIHENYPDIRKIINSLLQINNNKFDIFCHDFTSQFTILQSKSMNLESKLKIGENELFIQIPIFHENYLNMCDNDNISTISESLSNADVAHTYIYLNQLYNLTYLVVINGICIPSYYMKNANNYKIKYGSVLSKVSNKKTKDKIFCSTKDILNTQTIEQLKCLYEIKKQSKTIQTKIKCVLCC